MMNEEIICIAQFTAKEEEKEQLKQSLIELLEPTRNEEGCISYQLHENIENSKIFTMIEKFKNKDAFDFHEQQPYLENFKNIVGNLVDSVDVSIYKNI
jgi:quinol monooxygenase YgiN